MGYLVINNDFCLSVSYTVLLIVLVRFSNKCILIAQQWRKPGLKFVGDEPIGHHPRHLPYRPPNTVPLHSQSQCSLPCTFPMPHTHKPQPFPPPFAFPRPPATTKNVTYHRTHPHICITQGGRVTVVKFRMEDYLEMLGEFRERNILGCLGFSLTLLTYLLFGFLIFGFNKCGVKSTLLSSIQFPSSHRVKLGDTDN
jgi:hypothetical protein